MQQEVVDERLYEKLFFTRYCHIDCRPFNDFLSEGGKLWSSTKEKVKGVNVIEKLKNILSAARSTGIKVVYVPHRQTEKGNYADVT